MPEKAAANVIKSEFNVQLLETEPQWESGVRRRLRLEDGGLTLFANPAFDSWLAVANWQDKIGDIVTDECGQTYWSAIELVEERGRRPRRVWSLFRHNLRTGEAERVHHSKDCGSLTPQKMWLRRDYLWVLDRGANRLLALARDNFQIVYEIDIEGTLIDIDLGPDDVFHALVELCGEQRVCRYPTPPRSGHDCFDPQTYEGLNPGTGRELAALAVGRDGLLYLLDTEQGHFIRINLAEQKADTIGSMSAGLLKKFKPTAMQIDERGVTYLAEDGGEKEQSARLHLFDEDGSYLGNTTRGEKGEIVSWNGIALPEDVRRIGGIGFDRGGGVYLATDDGLAKFSLSVTPVGQDGVYYSKTLDNGQREGLWHRIALRGRIPEKTSVEVYYHASDSTSLKAAYDEVLASGTSVEEQELAIENLLKPLWKGPDVTEGRAARDASLPGLLVVENKGRYLWLKLRLSTFDARSRPSIRAAEIYYPQLSYLRYLPPAYREEPVSAAFLERFLALFETIFHGLDREIDHLHQYFDPRHSPAQFLRWLASWINLSIDDDLPEERVRRLVERAPELYRRKGTAAALTEFLEIYTGGRVMLTEHARGLSPFVLGSANLRLGRGTILLGSGVKGFRVGDTSVVGYSALRDKALFPDRVRDPDEPFLAAARRFTILVDMDGDEFDRRAATLRRIIDEQKPAHTACSIRLVSEQSAIGSAILGVGAAVGDARPFQVGVTPLGVGTAVAGGRGGMRIERGAWVGGPARL